MAVSSHAATHQGSVQHAHTAATSAVNYNPAVIFPLFHSNLFLAGMGVLGVLSLAVMTIAIRNINKSLDDLCYPHNIRSEDNTNTEVSVNKTETSTRISDIRNKFLSSHTENILLSNVQNLKSNT